MNNAKLVVYLGCDLFVEGQRWQAKYIQSRLEKIFGDKIEIYNPADNVSINNKDVGFASGVDILKADYDRLKKSDILIALFDTQDVGLAAEMGIAFERGIPIYQLHTDIRLGGNTNDSKVKALKDDIFQNDFMYVNKLVTGLSYVTQADGEIFESKRKTIFRKSDDLIEAIKEDFDSWEIGRNTKGIVDRNEPFLRSEIIEEELETTKGLLDDIKDIIACTEKFNMVIANFNSPLNNDNVIVAMKRMGNGRIETLGEFSCKNGVFEYKIYPIVNEIYKGQDHADLIMQYAKLFTKIHNFYNKEIDELLNLF